jgi:hypothetical protein
MRFYLVNRADRSRAYEVLEWKQAEGIVVLRGQYGVFDNLCDLNDPDIRDEWLLTQDMPDWIREKENAKLTRLQAGLRAGEGDERREGGEAQAGRPQPRTPHPDESWDGPQGGRQGCGSQDRTLEGW